MTILLLALTCSLLPVQPASLPGVWVAEHSGTVFMRLELRLTGGSLAGTLATGTMEVDKNGDVKAATPVTSALVPLKEFVVTGTAVTFVQQENDEPNRFRLTVIADDRAELQWFPDEEMIEELKEAGLPAPKPIALRKQR